MVSQDLRIISWEDHINSFVPRGPPSFSRSIERNKTESVADVLRPVTSNAAALYLQWHCGTGVKSSLKTRRYTYFRKNRVQIRKSPSQGCSTSLSSCSCLWTFQTHAFLKYQNFYCSDGSGHLHCAARQYYILYCPTDSILRPWSASHRWVEIAGWTVYWRLSASTVSTTTLTESLIRSPRTTLIYTT